MSGLVHCQGSFQAVIRGVAVSPWSEDYLFIKKIYDACRMVANDN
jgi:hypothetical protein